MTADEQPEWVRNLTNALGEFGKAMEQTGHILTAQTALGQMMRSDMEQARTTLAKLPSGQLQAVSVAASALSSLADEVAGEKECDDG